MSGLPQWILEAHQRHCQLPAQIESEDNKLLVSLGHPLAGDYRWIRSEFDQLAYAAASRSRFYSVADADNFSTISAPQLLIGRTDPSGPLGRLAREHAAAGWPHHTLYRLNCGCWRIKTSSEKLAETFQQSTSGQVMDLHNGQYLLTMGFTQPGFFQRIQELLGEYQPGFQALLRGRSPVLAPGLPADELLRRIGADMAGLPDAWL